MSKVAKRPDGRWIATFDGRVLKILTPYQQLDVAVERALELSAGRGRPHPKFIRHAPSQLERNQLTGFASELQSSVSPDLSPREQK